MWFRRIDVVGVSGLGAGLGVSWSFGSVICVRGLDVGLSVRSGWLVGIWKE